MRRINWLIISACLCLLPGAAAHAADQWPWDGGAPEATQTSFSEQDFRAMGARSLADVLAYAPGMFVHEGAFHSARGESQLSARSRPLSEVQVELDGIPLGDPVTGTVDLADISLSNVERVDVVRSPASPLYGPGGAAALVRVWTKRPQPGNHAAVHGRYGLPGELNVDLQGSAAGRGLTAEVVGAHADSTGRPLTQDFEAQLRENGGVREASYRYSDLVWARGGYEFSSGSALGASGGYSFGGRGAPVAVNQYDPLWQEVQDHGRWHARLEGRLPTAPFALGGQLGVLQERQRLPQFTRPLDGERWDNERYGFTRAGGALFPRLDLGDWSRISGRASFWLEDSYHVDYRTRNVRLVTARQGYALEDVIKPHPSVSIAVGGGLETDQTFFSEVLELPQMLLLPRGRLLIQWQAWDNLALVLTGAHQERAPDQAEQLDPAQGNIRLRPERFDRIEAGLDLRAARMLTAGFRTYLLAGRDLIRPVESSGLYKNSASAGATGIEMTVGLQPLSGMTLDGWVDWNVGSERPAGRPGRQVAYAPELTAGGRAGYVAPFGLGAQLQARYAGEFSDRDQPEQRSLQERSLPERLLTDARLFYRYKERFEVYLESSNLFDVYYETSRGLPEAGRSYGAGLRLNY